MTTLTDKQKDALRAVRSAVDVLAVRIRACKELNITVQFNIQNEKVVEFKAVLHTVIEYDQLGAQA